MTRVSAKGAQITQLAERTSLLDPSKGVLECPPACLPSATTFCGRGLREVLTSLTLVLAYAFSLLVPVRPLYDFAVPTSVLSVDNAGHLPFGDDVTRVAYAPPDPPIENEAQITQLFGMDTESVGWRALSDKWRRAKLDITEDLEVVARCHENEPSPPPAQRLICLSQEGAG
jgi:hypothetical protein